MREGALNEGHQACRMKSRLIRALGPEVRFSIVPPVARGESPATIVRLFRNLRASSCDPDPVLPCRTGRGQGSLSYDLFPVADAR